MMMTILLMAALPTWALVLIVAGAVLVVGALVYVVYRWGSKSPTATKIVLSGTAAVMNVFESFWKDDPDKLDAHDFFAATEEVAELCLATLNASEAGKQIDVLKEEMKVSMRAILNKFPGMSSTIDDELIARAVDAFFMLVHNIPKVNDIVKK